MSPITAKPAPAELETAAPANVDGVGVPEVVGPTGVAVADPLVVLAAVVPLRVYALEVGKMYVIVVVVPFVGDAVEVGRE